MYVANWTNTQHLEEIVKSTFVRLCPTALEMEVESEIQIGLALFHELIHMVSGVGDVSGSYEKKNAVLLAATNSEAARMNSNNYMLYSAQNGLTIEDY
jgi:hypothetical protein